MKIIKAIINFFKELFRPTPKKEKVLVEKIETIKEDLKEIDNEKLISDDINDILNK